MAEEKAPIPLFPSKASFEEAFKQYYIPLFKVVYPILKNEALAEDLVQEVFIKLWNKRSALYVTGSVKSYLYKVAINAALDEYNKVKKLKFTTEDKIEIRNEFVNSTEQFIDQKEIEQQIAAALDKLPPACKTIFILSREKELTYQQIADSLEISVKTVENQMGKALRIMREELSPYLKEFLKMILIIQILTF